MKTMMLMSRLMLLQPPGLVIHVLWHQKQSQQLWTKQLRGIMRQHVFLVTVGVLQRIKKSHRRYMSTTRRNERMKNHQHTGKGKSDCTSMSAFGRTCASSPRKERCFFRNNFFTSSLSSLLSATSRPL
uniref:Secreted protein n=1 Tax=Arundo donax TaxID=35708 RepID=A0A0A9DY70_ARUDO